MLEARLTREPGRRGDWISGLWDGSSRVKVEFWGNRAHAGAWIKGAKARLASRAARNPYTRTGSHPGSVGAHGFRNAWKLGFNSAHNALQRAESK